MCNIGLSNESDGKFAVAGRVRLHDAAVEAEVQGDRHTESWRRFNSCFVGIAIRLLTEIAVEKLENVEETALILA